MISHRTQAYVQCEIWHIRIMRLVIATVPDPTVQQKYLLPSDPDGCAAGIGLESDLRRALLNRFTPGTSREIKRDAAHKERPFVYTSEARSTRKRLHRSRPSCANSDGSFSTSSLNALTQCQVAFRRVVKLPRTSQSILFRGVAGSRVDVNICFRARPIYEVILSTSLAAALRMGGSRS